MKWILKLKNKKDEKKLIKVYSSNNPIMRNHQTNVRGDTISMVEMNQQDSSYNMFGNIQIYVQQEFSVKVKKLIEKNNNEQHS